MIRALLEVSSALEVVATDQQNFTSPDQAPNALLSARYVPKSCFKEPIPFRCSNLLWNRQARSFIAHRVERSSDESDTYECANSSRRRSRWNNSNKPQSFYGSLDQLHLQLQLRQLPEASK